MNDLIDRQAAIDAIDRERKKKHLFNTAEDGLLEARGVINTLPSAEPKRGKWIVKEKVYPDLPNDSDYRYECSLCGSEDQHNEKMIVPYCWHCGARMDGE